MVFPCARARGVALSPPLRWIPLCGREAALLRGRGGGFLVGSLQSDGCLRDGGHPQLLAPLMAARVRSNSGGYRGGGDKDASRCCLRHMVTARVRASAKTVKPMATQSNQWQHNQIRGHTVKSMATQSTNGYTLKTMATQSKRWPHSQINGYTVKSMAVQA